MLKNWNKPLLLVTTTSLLSSGTFAQYPCGPKMDYNLNYQAEYREPCPSKSSDYQAFKKSRLHKDHSTQGCIDHGKASIDTVENYRPQSDRNCITRHKNSLPCSSCQPPGYSQVTYQHNACTDLSSKYQMSYTPSNLEPFDSIIADGDTQIVINGGQSQSVTVSSKVAYPDKLIDVDVHNRTLFLSRHNKRSVQDHAQQTVVVHVNIPNLRYVALKGAASVIGFNIQAKNGLCVESTSSGQNKLQGMINLTSLVHAGPGAFDVQWVNSESLRVRASDSGHIKLAGTVHTVDVKAIEKAEVDGKYLRAHNALIQTGDLAEVHITAIDALSGFASDFSNIKHYKTPKHLTSHTYASGNVMQMFYWN